MFGSYTTFALAMLATASAANPFAAKQTAADNQAAYMSKLLSKATPTANSQLHNRRLADDDANEIEVDITGYSLRFEKCQFVRAYDQDMAEGDYDTVLATQRFVIFRLCPSDSCSKCNSGFGEYMVDMEEYLGYTVEYRQDEQDEMCEACDEQCYYAAADDAAAEEEEADEEEAEEDADEEDGGRKRKLSAKKIRRKLANADCDTCVAACEKIEQMEDNKYLDATAFINCQNIQEANDDDGNQQEAVYAGPICASNGKKIKIGVFKDEDCMFIDSDKDVENYLTNEDGDGMNLSHALLKTVYNQDDCISCAEEVEADENGYYEAAEVKDVCAELYDVSAKCETSNGFDNGMTSNYYYAQNDAANQLANEELVCDFISSLKSNTYSQDGEIVIGGSKVYTAGGTTTTGGQKFALTFFIIGTVGLAVYAAMLHSQLTKGGKADLSSQGGAMA